jgi:hypothetical protein
MISLPVGSQPAGMGDQGDVGDSPGLRRLYRHPDDYALVAVCLGASLCAAPMSAPPLPPLPGKTLSVFCPVLGGEGRPACVGADDERG